MSAPAAPAAGPEALESILLWSGALALLALVGGVAIYLIRRAVRREPSVVGGFTLEQLRALRASGALSDEEYERARAAVIGRVTSSAPAPGGGDDRPRSR